MCRHGHPVALDLQRGEVVSDQTQIPAELLYEYVLQTTQVVEFGVSIEALMAGRVAPPPEGVRFDVHFEGPVTGTKLNGSARGVDYVHMRADGRTELNIHAEVTTADGKKIALSAGGVGDRRPAGASVAREREADDLPPRVRLGQPDPGLGDWIG